MKKKITDAPKWKLVGATAAIAGLGVGGVLGATLGNGGDDAPVRGIDLQERIAVEEQDRRTTTTTTTTTTAPQQGDSVSSPLDRQSVASVRSVRSAASPASPASAASPAARSVPRQAPAARATAPAPRPAPAPRIVSHNSPPSAPSAPSVQSVRSAASPASVDSP